MHPETRNNDLQNPSKEPETANTSGSALNTLSSAAFYLAILFFIIGLNFSDVMVGNWYQQFMPDLNGRTISDVTFLDSLTGFAVTNNLSVADTGYILKTTNGGDNWTYNFITNRRFNKIQFINLDTGFVCGGSGGGTPQLYKTTNAGTNWNILSSFGCAIWSDMHVLSNDTIWLTDSDGLCGGVYRTTNGGGNWDRQLNLGSNNPDKIYFYNRNLGFCGRGIVLYRTTNSGVNWNIVPGEHSFTDRSFVDSLTGWKVISDPDSVKKTTNGGLNWFKQLLPPEGGFFNLSRIIKLAVLNKDTLWGVGARGLLGFANARGLIYKTTDGGSTWGYQLPDTNIHIVNYFHINFTDKLKGWAYNINPTGVHTKLGGDTTIYIGLQQISTEVPKEYELYQNYPNPFNPRTVIPFSLKQSAHVKITIYNITGREVQKLANRNLSAGRYEVDFMGKYSGSGVYFYRIEVAGKKNKQLYTETKKMILLK